jgi:FKBP-type peptidyl-prolyl cis-trans isomerase SlyD
MEIAPHSVVTIAYTLRNDRGDVLDTSAEGEPLAYLHGTGSMVPGLEKALAGRRAGEKLDVTLEAAEGYGERDDRLVRNVPIRRLAGSKVAVGATVRVDDPSGPRRGVVTAVRGDYATVDGNHPLAGQTLRFEIEIVSVREATAEELEHGHPHTGDGHHHHP